MRWISSATLGSVLLALFVVTGCNAAAGPTTAPGQAATPGAATPGAAYGYDDEQGESPIDEPPPDGPVAQVDTPVLVVHTGSMQLEVADLRSTVDQATAQIAALGGFVAESHEENSGEYQSATVTYRIPAARWDEALTGLRVLGTKVLGEDTNAQDVTAQAVDLDARIANLRATEAALQAIMVKATTIADVLKVQAELTGVRGDIESLVAQRDKLGDQAALGTLEVAFNVPVVAAAVATSGWDLGAEVDNAVAALVRVTQGITTLAVWFGIVLLPVAIPVVLIIWLAVKLRRRYESRRAPEVPSAM